VNEAKPRIEWIDQAKGWGMILVIAGHSSYLELPHLLIYSFHVPFFFALSGWLYNPLRYARFSDLARARLNTLVIPYFLYSAIGYVGLVCGLVAGHNPRGLSLLAPVKSTLLEVRNSTPYNGTLWFVACLLVTEFGFHWILRLCRRNGAIAFVASLVPLVLILRFPRLLPFPFPWSLDVACVAVFFFAFGHLIRTVSNAEAFGTWSRRILVPVLLVWSLAALRGGDVDMYMDNYRTPILFVVAALSGVLAAFLVVPMLPRSKGIGFVGRHSLVVLALHQWLAFNIIRALASRLFPGGFPPQIWVQVLVSVGYTLGSIAILWPICLAFDRWAPVLVRGRRG